MSPSALHPALRCTLALVAVSLRLIAAPTDAWPGDDYSGPLTPVSGTIGPPSTPLLVYGAYPAAGSTWRYKTDFTDSTLAGFIATYGNAWRNEAFDDSAWAQAGSQIGYGDSPRDEATLVPRTDYSAASGTQSGPVGLFRAQFTIANLASVAAVAGRVLFDDSCAVYVNGTQVYRHSDLTANAPLTEYTETTTTLTRENAEAAFEVSAALLHPGVNTIAVEVHQHDPVGGVLRLYRNEFHGSSGHNDLVDITAGKWGETPVLDVQDNHFYGPVGDEHIDLNGDAYIAGNIFENCTKDVYTSDHGYANGISSDVGGPETTIVVARNVFTHCDHAVNVKRGCAVIFEHNTVVDVNADYLFVKDAGLPAEFRQTVACSGINFFIPEDSGRAGDGAYAAWNIFHGGSANTALPRVLSWADRDVTGQPPKTTKLELFRNIVDALVLDPAIGSQHPDNVLFPAWQTRATANPMFVDRAARNYALESSSPVRNAGPFGLPPGHTIAGGCFLGNAPRIATAATSESITIGGPGIFAYRWRLDGGTYSAPISIAPGVFPRTGATIRTATLSLQGLGAGTHTLEVIGQDFAGNWQTTPAAATWLVSATPPARYAQWLAWYQLSPGDDSDRDGLDSLQEFAFATSPLISDPPPAAPTNGSGGPAFTFRLPEDSGLTQGHGRSGLTYRVESSEDLSPTSWKVIAEKTPTTVWTGTVTVGASVGGFVPVTVAIPTGGARLFLRLGLTPVAE